MAPPPKTLTLIYAAFLGGLLASAAGRPAGVEDTLPLSGPTRRLLATRTVSGKVRWADNNQAIPGATIRLYDNDVIGRDYMGQTTSTATGSYTVSYTVKNWDSCCFGAKKPDLVLDVIIGGRLYYRSKEYGNVGVNMYGIDMKVPRHIVKGRLFWAETCAAAVGATATVWDEDSIGGDDKMGATLTKAGGYYETNVPRKDGGSAWDPFGGRPDPYVAFTGPYGKAGRTGTKSDVSATLLDYGTTTQWRNDPSAAKDIAKSIGGDPQGYINLVEYPDCSPKRIVVTIGLKFRKATFSPPPNSLVPRMKNLIKKGIADNWSRVGPRAINVPGRGLYNVHVQVVESSKGYSTSLKYASKKQKSCERSNNVGIPFLLLDMTLWYNAGCAKYADPVNWQAIADADLAETSGHEWGHTVLQHAKSILYSWTHKGSSTIFQNPSGSATNWPPGSSDVDIMLYYKNGLPPASRTFATNLDVRRLIAIAKAKRVKRCGNCPFQPPSPPPPPKSPPPPSPPPKRPPPPSPPPPLIITFSPIPIPIPIPSPIIVLPSPSPSPPPPEPVPSPPPPSPTIVPNPVPRSSPPPPTSTAPSPPPPARTLPSPPPPFILL